MRCEKKGAMLSACLQTQQLHDHKHTMLSASLQQNNGCVSIRTPC